VDAAGLGRISEKWPDSGFARAAAEMHTNLSVIMIIITIV